jgi:hypothetical protein
VGSLNVVTVPRGLFFQAVMHRLQLRLLSSEPRFQSLNSGLGVSFCRTNFGQILLCEFDGLTQGVTF